MYPRLVEVPYAVKDAKNDSSTAPVPASVELMNISVAAEIVELLKAKWPTPGFSGVVDAL
jgi:hypothetical protein